MVTVLGIWETVWMESERTERRIWKQTIQAFAVASWGMTPVNGGPFTSPKQEATLAELLAAHPGPKTFLVPTFRAAELSAENLSDYTHPKDAIYVFGSTAESMVRHIAPGDDIVTIQTPQHTDMFAPAVLAAVLYDRSTKVTQ